MGRPFDESGSEPLTPTVFHILLALSDGPLHGYAVMAAVREASGMRMGPGTIYGTIQRLEEADWVEEVSGRSDGRRRSFRLLPAGRGALRTESSRLSHLAEVVRKKKLVPSGGK